MATETTTCLHLVVEIKGYRREDAKEKKTTMETYWVPGVNHLRIVWPLGVRRIHRGLGWSPISRPSVESEFDKMIDSTTQPPASREA